MRMFVWTVIVCAAGASLVWASNWQEVSSDAAAVDHLLERGEQALVDEDHEEALDLFSQARQEAERLALSNKQARAALSYGRALESWASENPSVVRRLPEAKLAYEEAIRLGRPDVSLMAQNNLGVLLIRFEDYAGALEALSKIELSAISSLRRRAAYQYNLARAFELNGEPENAFREYETLLGYEPGFYPAGDRAFNLIFGHPEWPDRVPHTKEVITHLLSGGKTDFAYRWLLTSLERLGELPDSQKLLAVLLQYYEVGSIGAEEFKQFSWGELRDIGQKHKSLFTAIEDIGRAFLVPFSLKLAPTQSEGWAPSELSYLFPAWTNEPWKAEAFSVFLKWLGDSYSASGKSEMALPRYAAAWLIQPSNTEAALYTAVLLHKQPDTLDPRGLLRQKLSQTYSPRNSRKKIGSLLTFPVRLVWRSGKRKIQFEEKGYDNLRRMYYLLADISSRTASQETRKDQLSANVQQLELAVKSDKKLQSYGKGAEVSPGLYMKLAQAYERLGNTSQAQQSYHQAAEYFAAQEDMELAKAAARKALSLSSSVSPSQRARTQRLVESLTQQPDKRPQNPDQLPYFMTRPFAEAELADKSKWELDLMLKEIYARHGLRFERPGYQQYFEQQPWYEPKFSAAEFPQNLLTEVQRRNANMIHEFLTKRVLLKQIEKK